MGDLANMGLIDGELIATVEELGTYAYEVPEDRSPPALITSLTAGDPVDPAELLAVLEGAARSVVAESDAGLQVVEKMRMRLLTSFPELGVA